MSMEHKAFILDFRSFAAELRPLLEAAVADGGLQGLLQFIERERARLVDPYEGQELSSAWREALEVEDAHQLGDFALTKYYDPAQDIGLGMEWRRPQEVMDRAGASGASIVLGSPVGAQGSLFDPGKMGSYFQSSEDVKRNLRVIIELIGRGGEFTEILQPVRTMLDLAARSDSGLYVTF